MNRFDSVTVALLAVTLSFAGTQLLLSIAVAPSYAAMYGDFGGVLPLVTRVALDAPIQSWLTGILLLLAAATLLIPLRNPRRIALGLLAVSMGMRIPLFFLAVYYPIFQLSSDIK